MHVNSDYYQEEWPTSAVEGASRKKTLKFRDSAMNRPLPLSFLLAVFLSGCGLFRPEPPPTAWELAGGINYVPIEPLAVKTELHDNCFIDEKEQETRKVEKIHVTPYQSAMPDQTVRMAVSEMTGSMSVGFGPIKAGKEGESYQVVVDYAVSDVVPLRLLVRKTVGGQVTSYNMFGVPFKYPKYKTPKDGDPIELDLQEVVPATIIPSYEVYPLSNGLITEGSPRQRSFDDLSKSEKEKFKLITVSTYVGYGLRITASIKIDKGTVTISGLSQLAAEASLGNVSGTMVVQTLGMTGELVSTNLPLPNELDRSTAQTAILAIGSIKALLHDPKMKIYPRIIGFSDTVGGGARFAGAILPALSGSNIVWKQPCHYTYVEET